MTKFEEFRGKVKTRWLILMDKVHIGKKAVCTFVKENPNEAASVACSLGFLACGTAYGAVQKHRKEKQEYIDRETRQYDPVSGQYYYTKRPLKNKEKLELDRRMAQGERKGAILDDMRLL